VILCKKLIETREHFVVNYKLKIHIGVNLLLCIGKKRQQFHSNAHMRERERGGGGGGKKIKYG
jgi:hypothetical protein